MKIESFFSNFELLTDAPNAVVKLRELILQLAVSGKLVRQDPNDEPASILLERIRTEKERLIKEKKIRDKYPVIGIKPTEIPFKIPDSWKWVRIGDIGNVVGGGTPKTDQSEYYADHDIPWITPSDLYGLSGKFVSRGKKDISLLGLQKSSAQLMPTGTVVFSSRAPIGYVAIAKNDLSTNQGFKSCVPFCLEMSEYIYYFLKFAAREIDYQASGTTFKEISGKEFSLIMIPIPPLKEQKRIVERVDYLMSLCNTFEAKMTEVKIHQERLAEALINKTSKSLT
ncbi:Restriction modification system DNA specificity domain protein (fragment) [Planktothrix serta PCC 8927]|uniref:Restriction modification system DNA specificity domain protein n=1 Tax=Planktothrix serta PCC 8927 TaxID=671068 RepID=A0A7Z9BT34_9CYAN